MPENTTAALKRFYAGKKIFLTGHTGFKGAWLSVWLLRLGAHVTGYALEPDTRPALFTQAALAKDIQNVTGDVRDFTRLQKTLKAAQPDLIFHLAAQPLVMRSYREPLLTFSTNVQGTAHLLQAARETGAPVVNITSDKCYLNSESGRPMKESDPLGGKDPYSLSKALSEQVTACWRDTLGFTPAATARAGNVLGGGDWQSSRLLPNLVLSARAGKNTVLRYPDAVRPWQYVLDALYGYLLLGKNLYEHPADFAQAWNFAPAGKHAFTVRELAEETLSLTGRGGLVFQPDETKKEASVLRLNSAKSRKRLGWRSVYDIHQTVRRTLDWYRRFYDGENARALTEEEISVYQDALYRPRRP